MPIARKGITESRRLLLIYLRRIIARVGPKRHHNSDGTYTTTSPSCSTVLGKYSDRNGNIVDHTSLSSWQRRRPRGGSSRTGAASAIATTDISSPNIERRPSSGYAGAAGMKNKRWVFLVCVSGLAWAYLIVHVLGPAVPGSGATKPMAAKNIAIYDSRLPGWTPLGHHARFMGEDAFPDLCKGWRDEHAETPPRPVKVNGVDVKAFETEVPLPTVDILLAILSGHTEEARHKRNALRDMYDRYEGWVNVGGKHGKGTNREFLQMSIRVVFVVSRPSAPPNGELVGDILYVNAPDGYHNIVHKVKHMMGLVRHFSFKYLLKADDDTFVCVKRLATFLHDQPEDIKDKIYAGVPTACNLPTNPRNKGVGAVIKDSTDKWYDEKFVHHTLSGLDCFPVYMQGAFYVLAQPLVEHLYRGRDHYDTFVNEDVTIGSWLLGVDRALAIIHDLPSSRLWDCACGVGRMRERVTKRQVFFHNCKTIDSLEKCSAHLLKPRLGC